MIHYIEENLKKKISIDDLVEPLQTSATYPEYYRVSLKNIINRMKSCKEMKKVTDKYNKRVIDSAL